MNRQEAEVLTSSTHLFPLSYLGLTACRRGMVVQTSTAFPFVPQMQTACCPGVVAGLHLLFRHVSQRRCWLLTSGADQEENTKRVLLSIDSHVEYTVRLTSLPPFPVTCPSATRCCTVLLYYTCRVPRRSVAHIASAAE